MENESNADRQSFKTATLVLSGANLFAGVGPASAEINGSIGIESLFSFFIGYQRRISSSALGLPEGSGQLRGCRRHDPHAR